MHSCCASFNILELFKLVCYFSRTAGPILLHIMKYWSSFVICTTRLWVFFICEISSYTSRIRAKKLPIFHDSLFLLSRSKFFQHFLFFLLFLVELVSCLWLNFWFIYWWFSIVYCAWLPKLSFFLHIRVHSEATSFDQFEFLPIISGSSTTIPSFLTIMKNWFSWMKSSSQRNYLQAVSWFDVEEKSYAHPALLHFNWVSISKLIMKPNYLPSNEFHR